MSTRTSVFIHPYFVGDHPALDFINTVYQAEGQAVDCWLTDADVLTWLSRAGLLEEGAVPENKPLALLKAARQLREVVRVLVMCRKDEHPLDVAPLNAFLAHTRYHIQLVARRQGNCAIRKCYGSNTPQQLLAPVAEAAAQLLTEDDFSRVRKCESTECILWFYDKTKAHRRRWCSMAICGNRHKVKSYRQRHAIT